MSGLSVYPIGLRYKEYRGPVECLFDDRENGLTKKNNEKNKWAIPATTSEYSPWSDLQKIQACPGSCGCIVCRRRKGSFSSLFVSIDPGKRLRCARGKTEVSRVSVKHEGENILLMTTVRTRDVSVRLTVRKG